MRIVTNIKHVELPNFSSLYHPLRLFLSPGRKCCRTLKLVSGACKHRFFKMAAICTDFLMRKTELFSFIGLAVGG